MTHSGADTVHVFDARVRNLNGLLHFDVMTTDETTPLALAKDYLKNLGEDASPSQPNRNVLLGNIRGYQASESAFLSAPTQNG